MAQWPWHAQPGKPNNQFNGLRITKRLPRQPQGDKALCNYSWIISPKRIMGYTSVWWRILMGQQCILGKHFWCIQEVGTVHHPCETIKMLNIMLLDLFFLPLFKIVSFYQMIIVLCVFINHATCFVLKCYETLLWMSIPLNLMLEIKSAFDWSICDWYYNVIYSNYLVHLA